MGGLDDLSAESGGDPAVEGVSSFGLGTNEITDSLVWDDLGNGLMSATVTPRLRYSSLNSDHA